MPLVLFLISLVFLGGEIMNYVLNAQSKQDLVLLLGKLSLISRAIWASNGLSMVFRSDFYVNFYQFFRNQVTQ